MLKTIFSILGGLVAVVLVFLLLFLLWAIFSDLLPIEVLFLMTAFVIGVIILFAIWGDPGFPLIIIWCLVSFGEAYFDLVGEGLTIIISLCLGVVAFAILSAKIYKYLKL